jgi:topoisomerase IV subunit B
MADLFSAAAKAEYTAADIEVLEGLEPVRRRPGMYIGGTDEAGLHHLVTEVLDNAMDEAVAGHATFIDLELHEDGSVSVRDNGRGIPVDPHPKFPGKSALEVILTTLHSGGKFSSKAYATSGGLHGVGISVVNALSEWLVVEVARDRSLYRQNYRRGTPEGPMAAVGSVANRRGTLVQFTPDLEIFGARAHFQPARLFRMARAKAYLYRGVKIRWRCAPSLLPPESPIPEQAELHFPNGLGDFLGLLLEERTTLLPVFAGELQLPSIAGRCEWAVAWCDDHGDPLGHSYCNTIPTPSGGSHENGFRNALLRAVRGFGELSGQKKVSQITGEDLMGSAVFALSVFIPNPQFQGQTKERLDSPETQRVLESNLKDHFDHWLSGDPKSATALITHLIERAEERLRRRAERELQRKTATNRRLRLPGKLTDCSETGPGNTEIFLVEGDSAGGSAKQARNRKTQAILPLRGKILNVASATAERLRANQELSDLVQALGCGSGKQFDINRLRYERVVIMTDADVDGAHIASLLMTFFFREMPGLISRGHLFLALPPLYRLAAGGTTIYAKDDADRERHLATTFKGRKNVEVSRFKGLGEMPPAQLRETTMDPATRTLLRVDFGISDQDASSAKEAGDLVERLMGRKPELRLAFIQANAQFVEDLDI